MVCTICYIATLTSENGSLSLYITMATVRKKPLENIVGNGENTGYQHFLFCDNALYPRTDNAVHVAFSFWSANAFNCNKSEYFRVW